MAFRDKAIPVPEAMHGDRWKVHDTGASGLPHVNMRDKDIHIPLTDDDHDRALRAHEQGHVLLTPNDPLQYYKAKEGLNQLLLNAIEDARVNMGIAFRGVDTLKKHGCMSPAKVIELGQKVTSFSDLTQALIALEGDGGKPLFVEEAQKYVDERVWLEADQLADEAIDRLGRNMAFKNVDGFSTTVEIARWLQPKLLLQEEIQKVKAEATNPVMGEAIQSAIDCLKDIENYVELNYERRDLYGRDRSATEWGVMRYLSPPREESILKPQALRDRRNRLSDSGVKVGKVYRICTDRKVFKYKKPIPGGTILIDASGSMSFKTKELMEMVEAAPALTVAIYSGYGGCSTKVGQGGDLILVIKDGKMVKSEKIRELRRELGNNTIDGPAIDWLVGQQQPRVWVSDGQVFAKDNAPPCRELFARLKATILKGRVMRTARPIDVADLLKQIHAKGTKEATMYEQHFGD